jgi:DNA polymerase III alpha subunit
VEFKVEGDSIRYALAALKNVGAGAMDGIVQEREANGCVQIGRGFYFADRSETY